MICWTSEPWMECVTDAIRERETGAEIDPDAATGAAGEVGAYQIMPCILKDLSIFAGSPWRTVSIAQMRHRQTAMEACKAYLCLWSDRLAVRSFDRTPTFLARVWNGGPAGPSKASTVEYGLSVANILATRLAGVLKRQSDVRGYGNG